MKFIEVEDTSGARNYVSVSQITRIVAQGKATTYVHLADANQFIAKIPFEDLKKLVHDS